jgi:hypothetical protein
MTGRPAFLLRLEQTPTCERPLYAIKILLKRAKDAGLCCTKLVIDRLTRHPTLNKL